MGVTASIITTVLSVIVGGAITAYFSRRYYEKASKELEAEASKLRAQSNLMLRALQEFSTTGDVEYKTNAETGEPEGLSVKRTAKGHMGKSGGEAHVEMGRTESEAPAEERNE